MKFTLAVAAATGAAMVSAQAPSGLPTCGQTCLNNMISIMQKQYNCAPGDTTCYCSVPQFGYGVRDCANEACANPSDAATSIEYGLTLCKSQNNSTSGAAGASTSGGATESAAASTSGGASQYVTTSPLLVTITTGSTTVTSTTGSTTITGTATDSTGGVIAGAASVGTSIGSAAQSGASDVTSAVGSGASGASSAAASGASTQTVHAAGVAFATQAPLAGAAALAALILL